MRILLVALLAVAAAHAEDLPEPVRTKLARDGIAVGTKPLRQVFEAYVDAETPVFITSDSILNGFHVLLEESILRLESARASNLGDALAFLYAGADGLEDMEIAPALREAATRRLRIFLGTALLLLGREAPGAPPEAAEEAARIEKAEGVSKPAWLGPPDDGFVAIDYARYKPQGFYARKPELARYFRALGWLQAVPFRVDRDEEFVAILLLHDRLGGLGDVDHDRVERARSALTGYQRLLGSSDDLTLLDALGMWTDDLEEMRAHYRRAAVDPEVQDQVATTREASVRVVGAARTPDALLFQRTAEVRRPPDGLEVCAALGSAWARARLDGKVLAAVDATEGAFHEGSLYGAYLHCVAALLDAPEPDAPALFKGVPWQVKSCHTALAGWAQLRHTWTLQAKRAMFTLGMHDTEPGFVEPEPEFFARLGRLARDTRASLAEEGAFDLAHDRREFAALLREAARILREMPEGEADEVDDSAEVLPDPAMNAALGLAYCMGVEVDPDDWATVLKVIDESLPVIEDEARELPAPLRQAVEETRFDLEGRWEALEYLCGRLEAIAHKQLRGVAFSDAERQLIKGYGEWLADVMFYAGNTYSDPHDDAMRISEVFFDPARGKRLLAGIGRPHPIWVVYPWQGKDVICKGAVMAYHEFERDAPLDDTEWKALLDSPAAPKPPLWAEPLYAR